MRKVIFTVLAVLAFAMILPACSTTDSLEDTIDEIPTETSLTSGEEDDEPIK